METTLYLKKNFSIYGNQIQKIKRYVTYFNCRYKDGYIIGEIRLLNKSIANLQPILTFHFQLLTKKGGLEFVPRKFY